MTQDPVPKTEAEAVLALSFAIRSLETALTSLQETQKILHNNVDALANRMQSHSLKCPFSPERNGMAQDFIERVKTLETGASEIRGMVRLVKWLVGASVPTLGALIVLLVKVFLLGTAG